MTRIIGLDMKELILGYLNDIWERNLAEMAKGSTILSKMAKIGLFRLESKPIWILGLSVWDPRSTFPQFIQEKLTVESAPNKRYYSFIALRAFTS